MLMASPAFLPRIKSITKRAFCGETRTNFAVARASIASPPYRLRASARGGGRFGCRRASRRNGGRGHRPLGSDPCAVPLERPRGRKLTELMTHHILRNVHGNEFLAVVDCNGVTHHLREDCGAPRPRLYHFLLEPPVEQFDFFHQVVVHKRTFFQRPPQMLLLTSSRAASR